MTAEKGGARRPDIDWELVERDYRAGLKTLRQMAEEHGISHVTIAQRAKRYSWQRDLREKIRRAAENKATKAAATKSTTKALKTDAQVVEAYSDVVASVDLTQREDVGKAIETTRGQLQELSDLSDPEFRARLEWLGQVMDESGPTESGGFKHDKANELYRYIISLAGRIKMAKEISASYGVYIPIQRKIFGLDTERKSTNEYEDLLRRIGESAE